jgi:hypothetical protein
MPTSKTSTSLQWLQWHNIQVPPHLHSLRTTPTPRKLQQRRSILHQLSRHLQIQPLRILFPTRSSTPSHQVNPLTSSMKHPFQRTATRQLALRGLVSQSTPPKEYDLNLVRDQAHMTVERAVKDFGTAADEAINAELRQMIDKKVWTPINPSEARGAIPSTMFIKKKVDAAGAFVKYKARLVAGGHKQMKDPTRTFYSPTMSSSSLLAIIAIAASEQHRVATVDINGAYLLAEMNEEVIMTLSPLLSKKALYGCVQSANLWYKTIESMLLSLGFTLHCTQVGKFDSDDEKKFNKVLKYLHASPNLGITLECPEDIPHIDCYVDASYGITADRRSQTGMAITIGKGAIISKSTRQKIVTKSSTESELVACSDVISIISGIKALTDELGFPIKGV